ncbi:MULTISPECIES: chaplin [unclassified Streptomyces]|uniref:chaplin n=1 Tax=unclassified Streptomyces TaxID=2593676 RepID=UPI0033D4E259
MNRIAKAAALTAAASAAVVGSAGGALALDGHGHGGSHAQGKAIGSPGVISGNVIQVPVNIPVNVCGNSVNLILSLVNPTLGNVCINR